MLAVTNCEPASSTNGRAKPAAIRSAVAIAHALAGDLLQQQPELVAAEAGDRVGRADRFAQACGDADQQVVAGLVAERVVDLLEVVDVDEQDRGERAGVPADALERLLEAVGEQHAVGQAGERIVQRAVLHRVLCVLALDRVREDVGERDDEVDVVTR